MILSSHIRRAIAAAILAGAVAGSAPLSAPILHGSTAAKVQPATTAPSVLAAVPQGRKVG